MLHGNEGNYFVRKPQKHRRLQLFSSCLYAINTKKILKIAAFLFRFLLIFAEWLNSYLARVQIPISHFLWAKHKKICGFWKSYGNKLAAIKTKKCHYQSLLIKILRTVIRTLIFPNRSIETAFSHDEQTFSQKHELIVRKM